MLSLSRKTDYALLALAYLTRLPAGRAANTREIAESDALPVELLAKILQQLTKAKILASTPGPTGGYRLARAPEAISIGAIVEVIDGPPALMPCMAASPTCDHVHRCVIRKPLARINARIFQMLNHMSLAEVAGTEADAPAYPLSLELTPRTPEFHTGH